MAKKQVKKEKRKRRHFVGNTMLFAVVLAGLAGLLLHFGGLGMLPGMGNKGAGDGNQQVNASVEQTSPEQEEASSEDITEKSTEEASEESSTERELTALRICVSDEKIMVEDEVFEDSAALKEYILSVYEEGISIELQDDHAVKAAYDLAKNVLDELHYPYTETE